MRKAAVVLVLLSAMVVRGEVRDGDRFPSRRPDDPVRAAGYHYEPVAASNGDDFFSAWLDTRGGGQELYGTIVRRDGTVVSPLGMNIAFPDMSVRNPAVVWDGEAWVVVWIADIRLRLMRLDRDGNRLEPEPRTLFDNIRDTRPAALASNGDGSLVAVSGRDYGPSMLQLAALDRHGNAAGETRLPSPDAGILSVAPMRGGYAIFAVIYGGELQVWHSDTRARLENEKPIVLATGLSIWTLHSASVRDRVLLTYSKYGDPLRARLGDGRTFGPPFTVTCADDLEHDVIADGDAFLAGFGREVAREEVDWSGGDVRIPPQPVFDIHTVRVALDGSVSDEIPLVQQPLSDTEVALAAGDGGIFTAFIERKVGGGLRKVAAAVTDSRTRPATPIDLARSARIQSAPAVAAGREGYLVVWEEEPRNDLTRAIMARFPGRLPFLVSAGDEDHRYPSVAFDGERYLVAWIAMNRPPRMVGRFVEGNGVAVGPQFDIATDGVGAWTRPALASNGDGFVLAWGSMQTAPPGSDQKIHLARIARGGAVSREVPFQPQQSPLAHELVLAGGASYYALGWATRVGVESAFVFGGAICCTFISNGLEWEPPAVGCYDAGCVIASHGSNGRLFIRPFGGGGERSVYARSSYPRIAAAGPWLLVFYKSLDTIGVWLPEAGTIANMVESRLTQRFAADVSKTGNIVVAWEAPSPRHDGVRRIHVTTFDASRIGR